MKVLCEPGNDVEPTQTVRLLRPGKKYYPLTDFDREPPKTMIDARRKMLREDIYDVLVKTRPNMSESARSFWLQDLGGKAFN